MPETQYKPKPPQKQPTMRTDDNATRPGKPVPLKRKGKPWPMKKGSR